MYYIKIIVLILIFQNINCDNIFKFNSENNTYAGECFPTKYLLPEFFFPSTSDLEYYIKKLHSSVTYLYNEMIYFNDTEVNIAVGMFFMKAVLKRAIRDHSDKLSKAHLTTLKDIIKKGESCVSNYVYGLKQKKHSNANSDLELRVATVLRDDTAQVYSMGDFNKGRLRKWILSNITIHQYVEKMDNMTLTRKKYAHIIENMDSFFVSIGTSDECLSRVVYNPVPIDLSALRPCVPDPFCRGALLSSPSTGYALSHRLFNLLMLRHSRRCYIQSEKEDDDLMDSLCAFMYREAVYIARFGYFSRDLFLEHVALCSLLGYEEFFRHRWYRKATSWMDDEGCIYESHNFMINRGRIHIENEQDVKKQQRFRKRLKWTLIEECHNHPMALLNIVLAQAVRHTLYLLTE